MEEIAEHCQKLQKKRIKSGSQHKSNLSGDNNFKEKDIVKKRSTLGGSNNTLFKIKNKSGMIQNSKFAARNSNLIKEGELLKEIVIDQALFERDRCNKTIASQFINEWNRHNDDYQMRKVRVMVWQGEHANIADYQEEVKTIKSDYLRLKIDIESDQNKSRKEPITNLDFPVYAGVMPKLLLKWDANGSDRDRIRQMRLRKIIKCANLVLQIQRIAKKLVLLKEYKASIDKAKMQQPLLTTKLADETYKMQFIDPFELLLDEVNVANDPLLVETQVLFKKIPVKVYEFPISWSEDLAALEPLKINYVETNEYIEKNPLSNDNFFPLTLNVEHMKKGAYDESSFLG